MGRRIAGPALGQSLLSLTRRSSPSSLDLPAASWARRVAPGTRGGVMSEVHAPEPGHLVVVGASAGGIEALSVLVSGLTQGFPAPVVLAQHLDPSRPSMLPDILERRTTMLVETVTGDTRLESGHVYVI